jgi:hypothetical protein
MIFERGYFNSTKIEKAVINESLAETRTSSFKKKIQYKPTVFVSHKHEDLEDLQGVMGMLNKFGAIVYLDSMDNKMPEETCGDTAMRIKEVIKYCKKFIFLATEKAIESYWCNWELGIGDVHKFINNIAILPMKEKGQLDSAFKGNEYLQIYPSIVHHKAFRNIYGHFFEEGYYVRNPKDKDGNIYNMKLDDWLKN